MSAAIASAVLQRKVQKLIERRFPEGERLSRSDKAQIAQEVVRDLLRSRDLNEYIEQMMVASHVLPDPS